MYVCKLCTFTSISAIAYVKHCRFHSSYSTVPCGVPHCGQQFRKMSSFYGHVSRYHGVLRRRTRYSFLYTAGITVRCSVEGCNKVLQFTGLVKHLYGHIACGISVKCPAQGCGRLMSKRGTFSAHLSIKHGVLHKDTIDRNLLVDSDDAVTVDSDNIDTPPHVGPENSDDGDVADCDIVEKGVFMRNFALFLLKLQSRCNVPASTVEMIAHEVYNLHTQNREMCLQRVRLQLANENVNSSVMQDIMDSFQKNDFFNTALNTDDGLLRSQHIRKQYYKDNFRYVEPVEMIAGKNKYGSPCSYHYIPLHETIKSLLQDESVENSVNLHTCGDESMFLDIHDGHVFKHICKTVHLPFLQIVLYQDAFEIVNPIGSARKLHKIIAVYMSLANLPPHLRTTIDNLQLVLLCRETDINHFGQDKIFCDLIRDLQDLELNGITVKGRMYEARLICFLGDNLGSHWLGGFMTNFSVNKYVCRYCLVQRTGDSSSLRETADLRTPEQYNNAVNSISETVASVEGILRQSVFNSLKYYHVCLPGLPPCLGHDLFEGVVQFDLSLILKELCKGNHHMSFKHLNRAIKQFHFVGTDAVDKPGVVSDGRAIGGDAVQVWSLVRLLPLLLYDVVDLQDSVWYLLILLREIVELVCAPKISFAQVLYLNRLIQEYVEDRSNIFQSVPLRPKHHYLLHYPWLITMFGPLIRVWTMRMESKHAYFKRCARTCRNFRNITKTLSETHQLSQAFLSSGSLLCNSVDIGCDSSNYDENLFSSSIVSAVRGCNKLIYPLQCMSNVTVRGTKYCKGAFVVLSCTDSQPVFGEIWLCFSDSNGRAAVLVKEYKSEKNQALGLFVLETGDHTRMVKCVLIAELVDYYPLYAYSINGVLHIALKHALYVTV